MVNVGDTIKRDQPVLELETDKATIEVPSSVAGVVREVRVKKGEKIAVGAIVLTVDEPSGNGAGAAAKSVDSSAEAASVPKAEPAAGAKAKTPDSSAEAPSGAKAEAPSAGQDKAADQAGQSKVVPMPPRQAAEPPPPPAAAPPPRAERSGAAAPAAPSVRRLAREIGVDVHDVQGTGPAGRISQDDVKEHAR